MEILKSKNSTRNNENISCKTWIIARNASSRGPSSATFPDSVWRNKISAQFAKAVVAAS